MMNAVVFRGPGQVAVERRPVPTIRHPKDIVVRVQYTALCGRSVTNFSYSMLPWPALTDAASSDLHLYRGYEECTPGTIMGHEFCGVVMEVGEDIQTLEVGAVILSPFTVSW